MTALRLAPIDLAPARAWIQRVHSHLDAPIGGKVAVAVERSVSELQRRTSPPSLLPPPPAPLPPSSTPSRSPTLAPRPPVSPEHRLSPAHAPRAHSRLSAPGVPPERRPRDCRRGGCSQRIGTTPPGTFQAGEVGAQQSAPVRIDAMVTFILDSDQEARGCPELAAGSTSTWILEDPPSVTDHGSPFHHGSSPIHP